MSTIIADSTLLSILSQMKETTEIRDSNGRVVGTYTPSISDEDIRKIFDLERARQRAATETARPFREIIDKLEKLAEQR